MKKLIILSVILLIATMAWSQNQIPLIGSKAPSFTAETTNGNLNFPHDFGKNWKVLMSHPGDFTPVCTSEILKLSHMQEQFSKINVKLAIISTESLEMHQMWKKSIEEIDVEGYGKSTIEFPIIDDKSAKISKLYGMLHEPISTTKDVRGVFVICPKNKIHAVNFYPMSIGRNMDEVYRLVVALQTSMESEVLTPVNWVLGDDVLVPYKPYSQKDLEKNPQIADQYYSVGGSMWFKKIANN